MLNFTFIGSRRKIYIAKPLFWQRVTAGWRRGRQCGATCCLNGKLTAGADQQRPLPHPTAPSVKIPPQTPAIAMRGRVQVITSACLSAAVASCKTQCSVHVILQPGLDRPPGGGEEVVGRRGVTVSVAGHAPTGPSTKTWQLPAAFLPPTALTRARTQTHADTSIICGHRAAKAYIEIVSLAVCGWCSVQWRDHSEEIWWRHNTAKDLKQLERLDQMTLTVQFIKFYMVLK